jgi:hypothetical protein
MKGSLPRNYKPPWFNIYALCSAFVIDTISGCFEKKATQRHLLMETK